MQSDSNLTPKVGSGCAFTLINTLNYAIDSPFFTPYPAIKKLTLNYSGTLVRPYPPGNNVTSDIPAGSIDPSSSTPKVFMATRPQFF
jgi:hypothetical protein